MFSSEISWGGRPLTKPFFLNFLPVQGGGSGAPPPLTGTAASLEDEHRAAGAVAIAGRIEDQAGLLQAPGPELEILLRAQHLAQVRHPAFHRVVRILLVGNGELQGDLAGEVGFEIKLIVGFGVHGGGLPRPVQQDPVPGLARLAQVQAAGGVGQVGNPEGLAVFPPVLDLRPFVGVEREQGRAAGGEAKQQQPGTMEGQGHEILLEVGGNGSSNGMAGRGARSGGPRAQMGNDRLINKSFVILVKRSWGCSPGAYPNPAAITPGKKHQHRHGTIPPDIKYIKN